MSDSACPHTLYMIQDPYEDQLVPTNDYTHLQGQAHTSLCADATEDVLKDGADTYEITALHVPACAAVPVRYGAGAAHLE